MVKAIIFDMDGTMLDSMDRKINTRAEYLKSLGVDLSDHEIKELDNVGWSETVHHVNKTKGTDFSPKAFHDGVLETHYGAYRNRYKLIPGFIEFLDYLDKRGIKYAIATATRLYGAEDVLNRFNLKDRFEFIITEGRVGYTKDYPNIYLEAAKKLGGDISNTIVFEDALYAVKTAKLAGFKTIAVKESRFENDWEEISKIADFSIIDFYDLMQKIESKEIEI